MYIYIHVYCCVCVCVCVCVSVVDESQSEVSESSEEEEEEEDEEEEEEKEETDFPTTPHFTPFPNRNTITSKNGTMSFHTYITYIHTYIHMFAILHCLTTFLISSSIHTNYVYLPTCIYSPIALYNHGQEAMDKIRRETVTILDNALLQRGVTKVTN